MFIITHFLQDERRKTFFFFQRTLTALSSVFEKQVLTNGYELALQLPAAVHEEVSKIGLVKGKDTLH